jgi:hypothetical protein
MKVKHKFGKWLAAVALATGVSGFSSAATVDLTGLGFVEYGDALSFSMPIADYQFNTNNVYSISSTPGAIQDLIVVATGPGGVPVTTNIAGIESAYATPNGSGSTFCQTALNTADCGLNSGTTGTIANANALTWDANLASMKTFLGGDQMVFFFNNNQTNNLGTAAQSLAIWSRITITDVNNNVIAAFDITNRGGKYALVTEGGGGVFFGLPTTYNAPNPTAAPGTYNPLAGSNLATDYVLAGGAICVALPIGAPVGTLPVPVPCGSVIPGFVVSNPISHNLGADHVAYAVLVPELNALMAALFGSLSDAVLGTFTMHMDLRIGCDPATVPLTDCTATPWGRQLTNGFEQLFIGTAVTTTPPSVPEPGIIALLALGLLGMAGMRNVNRSRKN